MKRFDEVWDPCPEGELVQLASALRQTHWLKLLGRTAGVGAIAIVAMTLICVGAAILGS